LTVYFSLIIRFESVLEKIGIDISQFVGYRKNFYKGNMKRIKCFSNNGEELIIIQHPNGEYCCPVCGEVNLVTPPYNEYGEPSFEICNNCKFHFGFDDTHLASKDAVDGIHVNWKRCRNSLIKKASRNKNELETLIKSLENINVKLAFDLIDIEIDYNK